MVKTFVKIADDTTLTFPVEDRLAKLITPSIADQLVEVAQDAVREFVLENENFHDPQFSSQYYHYDALMDKTAADISENDSALTPEVKVNIISKLLIIR